MKIWSPIVVLSVFAQPSVAEPIFAPDDIILGGARIGDEFVVGTDGFAGGVNNWPPAEPPADIINGAIGGGGEEYLNFIRLDSGFIITPDSGPSVVSSMELWVANDAVERDPASYEVWGTNVAIAGNGPYPISTFTLISEGPLNLPSPRDTVNDQTGFSEVVEIGNGQSYTSYLVLFPTVKGPGGNSMQLSEIQFKASDTPTPLPDITSIQYDKDQEEVTLTWASVEGASYTVELSDDLEFWDAGFANGIAADAGDRTTATFDLGEMGPEDLSKLFFRVEAE